MSFRLLTLCSLIIKVYTQTNDDPCISYKDLSHLARNTSSAESAPCGLDPVPTGWYRFDISGVGQVITDCPVENECGTGNRIWINGTMPEVDDGIVTLHACVASLNLSCCSRRQAINVQKCYGGYYVYDTGSTPPCTTICLNDSNDGLIDSTTESSSGISLMTTKDEYQSSDAFTTEPEAPKTSLVSAETQLVSTMPVPTQTKDDPCTSYKDLSHLARNTSFSDSVPCDTDTIPAGWYRFDMNGVGQVATDCPFENECGAGYRIWINGTMPEVKEGVISLSACVKSTTSLCCPRAQRMNVKKCARGFFVYDIGNLPPCTTVCLNDTNHDNAKLTPDSNMMSTAAISEYTTTVNDVTVDQTSGQATLGNATAEGKLTKGTDTSTDPLTVSLTSRLLMSSSSETEPTTTLSERSRRYSLSLTTWNSTTKDGGSVTSSTASPLTLSNISRNTYDFSSPTVSTTVLPNEAEKQGYKPSTEVIIAASVGGAVVLLGIVITVCVVKSRRRRW